MSTSGTPSVCILGVHRGRTLTALFIFSVPRWPKKVLIYSRTVNNHGNTSRRPSMSVCVYIHTTCIHCFMERLEKMVDSLSHLFFSASSSNIKDREKKKSKIHIFEFTNSKTKPEQSWIPLLIWMYSTPHLPSQTSQTQL